MGNVPARIPTRYEYDDLIFWLWAFLRDGEALLAAKTHRKFVARQRNAGGQIAQYEFRLAKYHFTSTMGSTIRRLNDLGQLFPEITAAWDNAKHLRAEAKDQRDMLEHADEYTKGKGQKPAEFVRQTTIAGLSAAIDATSDFSDGYGLHIGGRLNVETAMREIKAISHEAEKIVPPEYPRIPVMPTAAAQ